MNAALLLTAADNIERQSLGRYSNLSNEFDIASYILDAAGHSTAKWLAEGKATPFFKQAMAEAELPNDKLLWLGGWPEEWKAALHESWKDNEARAAVAAYAVRDYVEKGGWR